MHPFQILLAKWSSSFYRGNKYACNLCGFEAKKLRFRGHKHPVIQRKKILSAGKRRSDCPNCLSSDRDRRLWLYLENAITPQSHILHIAPEYPVAMKMRNLPQSMGFHYHCIDKRTQGYYYPKWVLNGDITALDFADDQFDWVIANHVLEHIPDLQSALNEVKRVLKPTGKAIFMVPLSQSQPTEDGCTLVTGEWTCLLTKKQKIERFGQHDHLRLFGTDMDQIFKKMGFDLIFLKYENTEKAISHNTPLALFANECIPIATPTASPNVDNINAISSIP
jgi:hypothetical protein